jgi:hypothetical protein
MPFCSIIITYGKDSSKRNLPLSLQEFEAYNEAYFFAPPSELYPIPKEIVPQKPKEILFESMQYLEGQ